jgi:type IV secretory pathway VirB10-like protein
VENQPAKTEVKRQQPALQIRPGYKFNILVDQDIIFPG